MSLTPAKPAPTIHLWLPLLLWIGAIFGVSSVPGPTLQKVGFSVQDGVAHGLEYGVLGLLVFRWLRFQLASGSLRAIAVAVLTGAVLGALDEFYQLLIPERTTAMSDWLADLTGCTAGAVIATIYYRFTTGSPGVATGPDATAAASVEAATEDHG